MTGRPTLRFERSLLRERCTVLACADEVGRGALSGPVSVGVVAVTEQTRTAPQGVRDSKLLSPDARARLAPRIRRWATTHGAGYGVGHASPAEIDAVGIMAAMRLAAHRALLDLDSTPDLVLLDGNHDYLSAPVQPSLLDAPELGFPPVVTAVKADLRCAAVAAASILAKTSRDALMVELAQDHPQYGWHENKGYASPAHVEALRLHGPSEHHRRSWSLPGCAVPAGSVPESDVTSTIEQAVEGR
ncbi:MAG: ribonuclease HII [Propionibacteriales bacterium]|nr:ribonuclease HII [Propionibacteriales bacterium]